MRIHILFLFLSLTFLNYSQKELTLQDCIDLGIKNVQNTISQDSKFQQSIVNQNFWKYSFLPTLNANTGYNSNYGRKIDPFTNTFGVNVVNSNSLGLSSQIIIFQGFRYFKQYNLLEKTSSNSTFDIERTNEKVKNQIIEKCILIWKCQIKIEQQAKIIEDLKSFKVRQTELVKEGRLSAIDTLTSAINLKTQVVTLLNYQREISFESINLNFLMGLPVLNETKIESHKVSVAGYNLTIDEYFQMEDLKNKLEIIELQNKVDKTQISPTLSFYGNVGTGYYSSNKNYSETNFPVIPYSTQLSNNAYQGIGFSLNVPLYNKGEYFRKQRIYEITKKEQNDWIEYKKIEITKKKSELVTQQKYVEETLRIQKAILLDKKTIVQATQMIYLEGKIRLSEVEKVEEEYYSYLQIIQDLEIEGVKMKMIKVD
jgi:outer membrane protein